MTRNKEGGQRFKSVLLAGISVATAISAATEIIKRADNKGKTIVALHLILVKYISQQHYFKIIRVKNIISEDIKCEE